MAQNKALAATGAAGLDDILGGGLTPNRLYLLEGMPGSGKTTLAFQFLMEGVRRGEPVLYVTLSETQEEIAAVADSHGWTLHGIAVRELVPSEESLAPGEQYTRRHRGGDDAPPPPYGLRTAHHNAPSSRPDADGTERAGGRFRPSAPVLRGRVDQPCRGRRDDDPVDQRGGDRSGRGGDRSHPVRSHPSPVAPQVGEAQLGLVSLT